MEGRERGTTGGIDGNARPGEAEGMGESIGQLGPGGGDAGGLVRGLIRTHIRVVLPEMSDEYTGALRALLERGRSVPGTLQTLPRHLKEQSALGINRAGLARSDRKQHGIEGFNIVEEAADQGGCNTVK